VYRETNPEQRKVYVDAVQTYQALEEARLQARHYSGYTARVPLHFGNSEHPQNETPAFFPFFAERLTMVKMNWVRY
jgi:hypothetical protein